MNKQELQERTKDFAHRCVKLCTALPENVLGNHIRHQLIRCSTSVAANYRASCRSRSKSEFCAKLGIVLEEADESCFWLEFVVEEKLLRVGLVATLLAEANELTAIFASARKTSSKS